MKFIKSVATLLTLVLVILHSFSPAVAQNNAKFKLSTACGYPLDWITVPWSFSCGAGSVSGTPGTDTITLTNSQPADGTSQQYIEVWTYGSATAHLTVTESATASGVNVNSLATYGLLVTNNGLNFSHSGSGSGNYGPASTPVVVGGGSCGSADYRQVYSATRTSHGQSGGTVTGTTTIDIAYGADTPVAVATGPYVGGVIVPEPSVGSNITINNDSYDPDEQAGTSGRPGICSAAWTVTKPDGSIATGATLASYTFTANIAGHYTVDLLITDNEGAQSQTTLDFNVDPRTPYPGSGVKNDVPFSHSCGDNSAATGSSYNPASGAGGNSTGSDTMTVYAGSGNAQLTISDPIATRSYPITNNLHINSQTSLPSRVTPFRNAQCTYCIEVTSVVRAGVTRRLLVDGDGTEFDYGPTSGAPTGEPGVYATLSTTGSGYLLTGAGAPEEIFRAGNFSYEFNTGGKLTKITDPDLNEQVISYNGNNEPYQISDAASGRVMTFEYDTPGEVARVRWNGIGGGMYLSYTSNRLTQMLVKDGAGNVVRRLDVTYNSDGTVNTVTRDNNSASTLTMSYVDARDGIKLANINWVIGGTSWGTKIDYFTTPAANASYRAKVEVGLNGSTPTYNNYDFRKNGDLIQLTTPQLNGATGITTYTYSYDSAHNLITSSNGAATYTYGYNSLGLVNSLSDTAGGSWSFGYAGVNPTTVADVTGTLWTLAYTDATNPNRPTTVTNALGKTWTYAYNQYGQLLTVTPPTGSPTGVETYAYEENASSPNFGYLKSYTNGDGDVITFNSYSAVGDLLSVSTSPATGVTNTSQMTYDTSQRLTQFKHPDNKTYNYAYNGRDLSSTVDEAGTIESFGFCATCGKMTSWDGPLLKALDWTLEKYRRLSIFTDARAKNTAYAYGQGGELKSWTFAGNNDFTLRYDNRGRANGYINGRNQTVSYGYDGADRTNLINLAGTDPDITFSWNTDDTLGSMTDGVGTTSFTYRANKDIQTVTFNYSASGLTPVQTIEYTYNNDDTVSSLTWKSAGTSVASWSYTYDGAGRVLSITNNFWEVTNYVYDNEGKLLQRDNSNGVRQSYGYNELRNWPTSISCKRCITAQFAMQQEGGGFEQMDSPGGPPWEQDLCDPPYASWSLTYDTGANTVGNLTRVVEQDGSIATYGYDALYRMTSESRTGTQAYSITYGYDLAGNITQKNGSSFAAYDDENTMTSIQSLSLANDNDGNQLQIRGNSYPLTATTFTADSRNKLITADPSGTTEFGYRYDGFGRRVYRQNHRTSPTSRRHYIYAGDTLIGEIDDGVPTVAYTWGPDGVASRRLLTGTPSSRFYCYGPQGETRNLTDEFQAVTSTYFYEAYGKPLGTPPTEYNPYRYGGKFGYYTDSEIQTLQVGARWYSPYLIRWMSRDPIHYRGGDNLYSYVMGNPVKYVDPSGLEPQGGMGPLTGNDEIVRAARDLMQNGKMAEAQKLLRSEIAKLSEKASECIGKERVQLLKRLKILRGALKVGPRYFTPGAPVILVPRKLIEELLEHPGTLNESGPPA